MKLNLIFSKPGYIANPYWPEMNAVIEIQKKSGVNRVRSEAKRRQALDSYLQTLKMDLADYEKLVALSARPFYTNGSSEIILPAERIMDCLVNASLVAPSAKRIDNIRCRVRPSNFATGKDKPDGVWERFVRHEDTNQRRYTASPFIENFSASGVIEHDKNLVDPKALLALLEFAGSDVGIGSCRKMGYGRFTVQQVKP